MIGTQNTLQAIDRTATNAYIDSVDSVLARTLETPLDLGARPGTLGLVDLACRIRELRSSADYRDHGRYRVTLGAVRYEFPPGAVVKVAGMQDWGRVTLTLPREWRAEWAWKSGNETHQDAARTTQRRAVRG